MFPRLKVVGCLVLTLVASAGTGQAGEVAIHGTASQGYLRSSAYNYLTPDTRSGTFSFNEALINFSARVDESTRVGFQVLGRDFGTAGNGEVILDWAFGDYRWRDGLGFRVGKVKAPMGLYNKTRDIDAVRTSILSPQSVYTESYRTVATAIQGVSVYGNLRLGGSGSLDYEVCVGNIEMDSTRFLSEYLTAATGGAAPMLEYRVESRLATSSQLIWNTPLDGLRTGASYSTVDMATSGSFALGLPTPWTVTADVKVNHLVVLSAEFTRDALLLAAEYTRWDTDQSIANIPFPDGLGGLTPIAVVNHDGRGGYYGQAAYRLDPVVELGAYYSVFHPDWQDRDGVASGAGSRAWQKDLALTARLDVTSNWNLKLEGHFINGTGDLKPEDNPAGFSADNWRLVAVKSTFSF